MDKKVFKKILLEDFILTGSQLEEAYNMLKNKKDLHLTMKCVRYIHHSNLTKLGKVKRREEK